MRKLELLWRILKATHATRIIGGFVLFALLISFFILLAEPGIHTYREALWFSFVSFTTIGYGDVVAVTFMGRILTVLLTLYGIFVVAMIPAIAVSYYLEFIKVQARDSTMAYLHKLERLEDLSREELMELSKKVRERKYKF